MVILIIGVVVLYALLEGSPLDISTETEKGGLIYFLYGE
jgi:hypothetical protein